MPPTRATHESRLQALEEAMSHFENPGYISSAEGVSLKEHFDDKLTAQDKAVSLALASMNERLSGINEIRGTLNDAATRFANRDWVEVQLRRLEDAFAVQVNALSAGIKELATFRDRMDGKASAGAFYLTLVLSGIGLVIGLVALFR